MSSVVESFYKDHFAVNRYGYRPRPRRKLSESTEFKTFLTIIDSAVAFFEERRNDIIDLPPSSGERAMVEAALGLLNQASSNEAPDNNDLRSAVTTLRDGLKGLVASLDSEGDMARFVTELTRSLADLHTQISADDPDASTGDAPDDGAEPPDDGAGPPDDAEPPDDGAEPPEDEAPGGEEEETKNLDDPDALARSLGIAK